MAVAGNEVGLAHLGSALTQQASAKARCVCRWTPEHREEHPHLSRLSKSHSSSSALFNMNMNIKTTPWYVVLKGPATEA